MNIKARNKQIAEMAATLNASHPSGFLYITSRDAGAVTEVTCANGARHLIEDSHTVSTPEEIAQFERRNAAVREQLQRSETAHYRPSLAIEVSRY